MEGTDSQFERMHKFVLDIRKDYDAQRISHGTDKKVTNDSDTGMDYIVTDIHENYTIYLEIIKQLSANDRLWILGDILYSRNGQPGAGINILLDIVQRTEQKEGPQIQIVLGNHDVPLIRLYEDMKKEGITSKDMNTYLDCLYLKADKEPISLEADKIYKKVQETLGSAVFPRYYLTVSDGEAFFDLAEEQQEKIYQLLKTSSYFVTTQVGEQKIALVHALPPDIPIALGLNVTDSYIDSLNMEEEQKQRLIDCMIWGKGAFPEVIDKWRKSGYRILRGHTPQREIINRENFNIGLLNSTRALYCIQTDEITYFRDVLIGREDKSIGAVSSKDLNELDSLASKVRCEYRVNEAQKARDRHRVTRVAKSPLLDSAPFQKGKTIEFID